MSKKKFIIAINLKAGYECSITDENGAAVPSHEIYLIHDNLRWVASQAAGVEAARKLQIGALYFSRGKRGVSYCVPTTIDNEGRVFVKVATKEGVVEKDGTFHFYEPQSLVLAKNQPKELL